MKSRFRSTHVTGRCLTAAMLLTAGSPALPGAFFGRTANTSSTISLRKRLHVNTLITEPGTMEVEWGNDYSLSSDTYTMPSSVKYTPEGKHVLWGRTEFAASFDTVSSAVQDDARIAHFGDRLTFAATCVLVDGEKLDIAVAPYVSTFLRGESGKRVGATAIARYDFGRNSAGLTATWSAATVASPANPAGTFDAGVGFGRRLKAEGFLSHFSPHANLIYERSTGVERLVSVFEGVEYQITEKFAVDFSGQHFNVAGGTVDHQIVVGITVNLGRLGRRAKHASNN